MDATLPSPDETPSLVPPARVPPVATGTMFPPGGGGGGPPVSLRRFQIMGLILLISGVAALAVLIWAIPQRAPTLLVALGSVAAGLFHRRRDIRSGTLGFFPGELYVWSIIGGVVGELVAQLVFHINPDAPRSVIWLLIGAVGIGGACGVGVATLSSFMFIGAMSVRLLRGSSPRAAG